MQVDAQRFEKGHGHEAQRERAVGEDAEDRVPGEPLAPLQGEQQQGDPRADGEHADGGVHVQREPQRHAQQRGVGQRVAEVGHPPPDDERTEGSGHEGHADAGRQRPPEKVIHRPVSGVAGVAVFVAVGVEREAREARRKEAQVRRVAGDGQRRPGAADGAVEADDAIRGTHDEVQVVRDHEDAAAALVADARDQREELLLSREVYPLARLVQHEQFGIPQQRSGQEHALHLPAGDRLDRGAQRPGSVNPGEDPFDAVPGVPEPPSRESAGP